MEHEEYMAQALDLAREAAAAGEVPVGCVIVARNGEILGRGRNRREEDHSPLAHAELEAIADACRRHGDWRLKGARLYVTLEPCPMCAGGIISARIPEVYYGAKDAGFGACGSVLNLFEEEFRHHPKIVGHILEEPCGALLREFFAGVREKRPENLKIL
ncbi:MAG: nucleoside deaminase [Clostridiales bacterium]|nr:nucleoside deaminase [Clostridiales bacterium]